MNDTHKWNWAQIILAVVTVPPFAALLVWTWTMPDMVRGLVLLSYGLPVVIIGVFLDARSQQHLDEMEIAARSFAARWSTVAVTLLALYAGIFDPFRSWLNTIYPMLPRHGHAEGPDQMFVLGVLAAIIVRGVGATLLRAAWMQARR
jgi:hypothetical protein